MLYISYFITLFYIFYTIFETYKFKNFLIVRNFNHSIYFNLIALFILIAPFIDYIEKEYIILTSLILLLFNIYKLFILFTCIKLINQIEPEDKLIQKLEKKSLKLLFSFSFKHKIITFNTPFKTDYIEHSYKNHKIITNINYEDKCFFTIDKKIKIRSANEIIDLLKVINSKKLNFLLFINNKNNEIFLLNDNDVNLLNLKEFKDLDSNMIELLNVLKI